MPDAESRSDDARRRSLAILAHEIRGALTAITGYSELLGRPLDEVERGQALEGIRRATHRIDALLAAAMDGGDARPTFSEKFDVREVAARVVSDAIAISGRSVVLDAGSAACVAGSADALERALANLVDNALKYSQSASEVLVRVMPEPERVLIQVLDRGPGIPEDSLETVFEPFFRLAGQGGPGTGLGLTVVRSVADAHRGRVWAEERPGGGSVLNIELPVEACEN